MAKKMNEVPKVRTRTRVRAGGDVVKTKTVTKGDGMRRVEKTKTKVGQTGTFTAKSVMEKGPMGKSRVSSYMFKGKEGGSYGGAMEKIKSASGMKTKRGMSYDTYKEPAESYQMGRGRKVSVPEYSSTDKKSMSKTKSNGMKSKVKKTTYGEGYDISGKYVPEKTIVKSKKSK